MDKRKRAEIRSLIEAMTPGPWCIFSDTDHGTGESTVLAVMPCGREGDICTFEEPHRDGDVLIGAVNANNNAPLISMLPQILPQLLDDADEKDRLQEEVKRLKDIISQRTQHNWFPCELGTAEKCLGCGVVARSSEERQTYDEEDCLYG